MGHPAPIGHVGIVTGLGADRILVSSVIHCSAGNGKNGDAICDTDPKVFKTKLTIFAWYAGILD